MTGTTCLVTGATSGIGKETALRLAALGATVILPARDAARGEAARAEIQAREPHARVEVMTADLSRLAPSTSRSGPSRGMTWPAAAGRSTPGKSRRIRFIKCRPAQPSALARDGQAAARMWALSEDLTGLDAGR